MSSKSLDPPRATSMARKYPDLIVNGLLMTGIAVLILIAVAMFLNNNLAMQSEPTVTPVTIVVIVQPTATTKPTITPTNTRVLRPTATVPKTPRARPPQHQRRRPYRRQPRRPRRRQQPPKPQHLRRCQPRCRHTAFTSRVLHPMGPQRRRPRRACRCRKIQ